jgi:hypothetical protein
MAEDDKELVDDDVQDDTEDDASSEETLESALEKLSVERVAREKADRDLSSLRGQVRSSRDMEDSMRGELSGIYKYLDILTQRATEDEDDEEGQALAKLRTERVADQSDRQLNTAYHQLVTELDEALVDEDGTALFESKETAPELEKVRELWLAGKTGEGNGRFLTMPERIASLTRAVAEAAKEGRIKERQNKRDGDAAAKKERSEARKRQQSEDGDLDLDAGGRLAGMTGANDKVSGTARIAAGLAKSRASGKRSSVFVDRMGPPGS